MNLLKESLVFRFFYAVYSAVGDAISGCFLYRVLALFFRVMKESAAFGIVVKAMELIREVFKGSFIYRMLYTKGKWHLYAKDSFVLTGADKLIEGFMKPLSAAVKFISGINCSSVNKRIYGKTVGALEIDLVKFTGILLIIMVLVPGSMWNNAYGLAMALILAFFYFISVLKGDKLSFGLRSIPVSMLLFMITCVYGVVISVNPADSIRVLMFFITSFLFMLVIGGCVNTEEKLDCFTGFMYWALMATAVICVIQGITGIEQDALLVDARTSGNLARAFSTFENPNNYAEFIVLFIPFAAAFALNREDEKQRTVLTLLLVIPLLALVLTYSRSCWVSFMIAAVVFILFYDYKLFPLFVIACIFIIPFLPESVWTRILSIGSMADSSNFYRIQIWQGTSRMFDEWALSGTGLGPIAFTQVYRNYAIPEAMTAPHSHMLFLEILLEAGIVSLISIVIWWLGSLKNSVTCIIRESIKGRKIRNVLIASVSALSGIIFVSLVEYVWFYPRVMIMFFVVAGVTLATVNILRGE